MVTAGAKFWYALTGLALAAAALYFATSGGEKFGTFVLAFGGVAAAVVGTMLTVLRDGDVLVPESGEVVREAPRVEALPAVWPALGALGVVVAVVGLAAGNALLWVGLGILVITLVEWMVQGWAERSTPDPRANQGLRNRLMFPFEIPALAVIGLALVIVTVSRVLLALPKTGAVVFASIIALVILGLAAVLANRPRISSSVLSGAVAVGAVLLVAGGIVGGVVGEREFEHHGEDELHEEPVGGSEPTDDAGVSARDDREGGTIDDDRLPDENAPDSPAGQSGDTGGAGTNDEGAEVPDADEPVQGEEPESVGDPLEPAIDDTTSVSTP